MGQSPFLLGPCRLATRRHTPLTHSSPRICSVVGVCIVVGCALHHGDVPSRRTSFSTFALTVATSNLPRYQSLEYFEASLHGLGTLVQDDAMNKERVSISPSQIT